VLKPLPSTIELILTREVPTTWVVFEWSFSIRSGCGQPFCFSGGTGDTVSSFVTYQSCPLEHWFSLPDSGKPPTTLPSLSSDILSLATTSCSHWLSHPSPSETTMYISTPRLLHLLSRSLPLDFIGPFNVHQPFLVDRALRHHHVFYKMRYFLIFLSRFLSSLQEHLINGTL